MLQIDQLNLSAGNKQSKIISCFHNFLIYCGSRGYELPSVPLEELLKRNILRFLRTGKYAFFLVVWFSFLSAQPLFHPLFCTFAFCLFRYIPAATLRLYKEKADKFLIAAGAMSPSMLARRGGFEMDENGMLSRLEPNLEKRQRD